MVVGTCAGEHFQFGILAVKVSEEISDLLLRHGIRKVIFLPVNKFFWNISIEVVQGRYPYTVQHQFYIILSMRKIRKCAHIQTISRSLLCNPQRP